MKFLDNKYTSWYNRIITNAMRQNRSEDTTLYERHHIIPVSLGGTNEEHNLVYLTFREHYVCHLLLIKMTNGSDKAKMWLAVWWVGSVGSNGNKRLLSSRYFQRKRQESLTQRKGIPKSEETKRKISIAKTGKKLGPASVKAKQNMSAAQKARGARTEKERLKISQRLKGSTPWMKGKKHRPDSLEKMRQSQRGNNNAKGKKHSQQAIENNRIAQLRRIYTMQDYLGVNFIISDMKSFCIEHELAYQFFSNKQNVGKKYQLRPSSKWPNSVNWKLIECKDNTVS